MEFFYNLSSDSILFLLTYLIVCISSFYLSSQLKKFGLPLVTGLIVAYLQGYVHQAMTLGIGSGDPKSTAIGIGMWLGIVMAYNVWFVIWPNQKKALGMIECTPEEKTNSAKRAMLFSRTNTLLSFPMLLSMVAAQNLY